MTGIEALAFVVTVIVLLASLTPGFVTQIVGAPTTPASAIAVFAEHIVYEQRLGFSDRRKVVPDGDVVLVIHCAIDAVIGSCPYSFASHQCVVSFAPSRIVLDFVTDEEAGHRFSHFDNSASAYAQKTGCIQPIWASAPQAQFTGWVREG